MKTYSEFKEIIAAEDEYLTSSDIQKKSILGITVRFYLGIAKVILLANKMVNKNIYNDFNWVASSIDILRITEKCGLKFHIEGMDNFNKLEKPVVFISNHMSTMETVTLPAIIHPVKRVVFVTKKELTSYPVFGPVNSARDPIIVGRSNAREDLRLVLEDGSNKIKNGKSIIIFPQRTRSAEFNAKHFNSLGVKLAKLNDVQIVPVALLTDAWGNGKYIKEIGKIDVAKKVRFSFGKPISAKGREAHQEVINFISDHLKKWGREDLVT